MRERNARTSRVTMHNWGRIWRCLVLVNLRWTIVYCIVIVLYLYCICIVLYCNVYKLFSLTCCQDLSHFGGVFNGIYQIAFTLYWNVLHAVLYLTWQASLNNGEGWGLCSDMHLLMLMEWHIRIRRFNCQITWLHYYKGSFYWNVIIKKVYFGHTKNSAMNLR